MSKYTKESLLPLNQSYDYAHRLTDLDVVKMNRLVELIENSRDTSVPMPGDIVEYTTRHGDYYASAHIEKIEDDEPYICERPYVPFVSYYDGRLGYSTSGGAWAHIPPQLKYVGKREKTFCDWGHMGACGNGAVHFKAEVNVWEFKELDLPYTTKTHSKFYININNELKTGDRYKYTSGAGVAFETDKDYQAWLDTFHGVEIQGHYPNQRIVWTYKQIDGGCIPLEEYLKVEGVKDSTLCNATYQECKRIYEGNTVTTYMPFQNDKIALEGINYSFMTARKSKGVQNNG